MLKRLLSAALDVAAGKTPSLKLRSNQWPKLRRAHLALQPLCQVCGGSDKLEVHHIMPFHLDPSLELQPTNLISLCESKKPGLLCHLAVGHLGNYRDVNPDVVADSGVLRGFFSKVCLARAKGAPALKGCKGVQDQFEVVFSDGRRETFASAQEAADHGNATSNQGRIKFKVSKC